MPELSVRTYLPADRDTVLRLGADTAYFGEPIEAYMEDRRVFLDAFYVYYTDREPEHLWVACVDGRVVGFLTGCVDTSRHNRVVARVILPRVLGHLLGGKYHLGRRTLRYSFGMLLGAMRREFASADLKLYPAHLHINLEAAWRGVGLGRRLLDAYLGQLRGLGVPGVHLQTSSLNEKACILYEKAGFQLLDARPERFWTKWFGKPVENRCYGLTL